MNARALPIAAVAVVFALLAATLTRVPTTEPDTQLYASIAKTWSRDGTGVPSVMRYSPDAVDHVRFYGPVYFQLVAWAFDGAGGVSRLAVRAISLAAAGLVAGTAAGLAVALGAGAAWPWAMLLVALTPELRYAATDGTMAALAVGLALAGLLLFVLAVAAGRRSPWLAAAAGVSLGLAALTTPRIFPFLVGFGLAGPLRLRRDRRALRLWGIATAVVVAMVTVWASIYEGSLARWTQLVASILTHERGDVAIVGTRLWKFSWSRGVTPLCAIVGAIVAAQALDRVRGQGRQLLAAEFALSAVAVNFGLTAVGMNLTFLYGIYFAVPLFVVIVALPWSDVGVPPRVVLLGAAGALALFVCFAGLTYVRVALTWQARDPERLTAFLQRHVPPGSAVIGPPTHYFFAAEAAGVRYWTANEQSFADWTRWVDDDPGALDDARSLPIDPPSKRRFLFWPVDDDLPDGYACAAQQVVATYRAPAALLPWLPSTIRGVPRVYPDAVLYALRAGCPTGYDPTDPANLHSTP